MVSKPSLSPCGEIVRSQDPDRYLCSLFTDPARREGLFALYAFNQEVAKIPEVVSEPMLGHIRLQWWRESIDGILAGTPREHEVVLGLAEAFQAHGLARDGFDTLLEAREADLEDAAPADMAAMIDHAQGTAGALNRLALDILGIQDPETVKSANDVAIGWALTGMLRSLPYFARRKRLVLPSDLFAENGGVLGDYHELRDRPAPRQTVRRVATVARDYMRKARGRPGVRKNIARPVLLPARIADLYLNRLERAGWNAFDPAINAEMPMKAWALWITSLLRRF